MTGHRNSPPVAPAPTASARRRPLSAIISKDLALDLTERVVVLALFVHFADKMLGRLIELVTLQIAHPELIGQVLTINAQAMLLVISEALGVVLILTRRRASALSSHPLDWALGFAGVSLPLLAVPAAASTLVPAQVSVALMLAGMLIQISAKLALWRSFGIVAANRGVKTGGPYRIVRHPMYAGYTLTHIGFLIGFPSLQNAMLYLTALAIEIARALREEAILNRDPAYRAYATRVRYRLLPAVF